MPPTSLPDTVDFDLRGIVRVRLLGARSSDISAVRRQLGPIDAPVSGEADIVVRFVDQLTLDSAVRLIGLDDAGFTDDAYLVFRSRHKARTRVRIPMADIGGRCEILCERGVPAIPLLIAIINLTALAKGYVPIHASAAIHRGVGVLIAGWAKGGKTELLLGLMAHGGRYVGDEWVYLAPDGSRMFGIPEPMKIWATHLDAMPQYRRRVSAGERVRLTALRGGARGLSAAAGLVRRPSVARPLRRVAYVADQQAYVHVAPATLFGDERCAVEAPVDRVVLALSGDSPAVRLEASSGGEVAARMTHSVQHERLDLEGHYLKFRFAFPDATNPHLEAAQERQRELLTSALAGTTAAILHHPYPAPIPAMFDRVDAWLR